MREGTAPAALEDIGGASAATVAVAMPRGIDAATGDAAAAAAAGASTPVDLGQWAAADTIRGSHPAGRTTAANGTADEDYHALSEGGRITPLSSSPQHASGGGATLPPVAGTALMPAKVSATPPATRSDRRAGRSAAAGSTPAALQQPVAVATAAPAEALLDADDDHGDAGPGSGVAVCFPERWRDKERRLAQASPFSAHPGWRLVPVIVKANDDLRQEQFTSQLLREFARIFKARNVPAWLRPYDILATEARGGLIHAIPDTISIDSLKRAIPAFTTLDAWFVDHFRRGPRGDERLHAARTNFVLSMAGYSIACYILNIKDRHNGNILLTRRGHIVHIDYGFLLTSSPGGETAKLAGIFARVVVFPPVFRLRAGNMNFESAPFKLTSEFVQVMCGTGSQYFALYRSLLLSAFLAIRQHKEEVCIVLAFVQLRPA